MNIKIQAVQQRINQARLFLGIESNKAKTQRITSFLKETNTTIPNASLACFGIAPERLNSIKSWKELPKNLVDIHNTIYKKPSLVESLKGLYCHYVRKI